jgi:hypothetical protein
MPQHLFATLLMIGLFTIGGLAAIRYLFPKSARSRRLQPAKRLTFRSKSPMRF